MIRENEAAVRKRTIESIGKDALLLLKQIVWERECGSPALRGDISPEAWDKATALLDEAKL